MFLMVETLGEARANGWRITARCGWGKREAMKSIRECKASIQLDLDTLIWTRGAVFPVSMLEGRSEMSALRLAARCASIRFTRRADREAGLIKFRAKSVPKMPAALAKCWSG